MKRIESSQNPTVQAIRKITNRKSLNKILLEGKKIVLEAINSQIEPQEVLATQEFWKGEPALLQQLKKRNIKLYVITPRLLNQISSMTTPPGVLAVASRPQPLQTAFPLRFGCLLLSVRDPGNLGTILRSAEAGGCEFVACTDDCADPFQPKVVRASMGSVFRIPTITIGDPFKYIEDLKREGIWIYGLVPRANTTLFETRPVFPSVIIIGSESHGIPPEVKPDATVSIPMRGNVESLNVAMAATLCFYHFSYGLCSERNIP